MRAFGAVLAFLCLAFSSAGAQSGVALERVTRAHRTVATQSASAQAAFDDGLTLLYAFNPEEARRSFELAAKTDPALALAWWGVAMSYGPNINTPFGAAAQRHARDAVAEAKRLGAQLPPVDRALIAAAEKRFAFAGERDADRSARAYRDAMYGAADAFPQDDDVQALAAEAEMDLHPFDYFSKDGRAAAGTAGIIARLRGVIARTPLHLGANHYLIHVMEQAPQTEESVAAARRLAALDFEPAAEHLAHMPAHALMRVGDYRAAGAANAKAVDLYRTYLANDPAGHADYFQHDCVFGVDAFMMAGEYRRARDLARACKRTSGVLAARVDLRFRRFDALAQDADPGPLAAGLAAVHEGRLDAAARELATLRKDSDGSAAIASALLTAALAAARADGAAEIAALEHAVALQDAQGYSEPPAFWYPVRESLGAALLRAGREADAERVFRADLERNPANPRSLFALAQTLAGEGRASESENVRAQFARLWPEAEARPSVKEL